MRVNRMSISNKEQTKQQQINKINKNALTMRVDESPRTVDTMWEATEFESIAEQIPSYLGVQLSNATSLTAQKQKITHNVQCVDSGNFSCIRNSETPKASFKLEVFVGHNLVWVFAPGLFLAFFILNKFSWSSESQWVTQTTMYHKRRQSLTSPQPTLLSYTF